jgi:hypothetical protein
MLNKSINLFAIRSSSIFIRPALAITIIGTAIFLIGIAVLLQYPIIE